MGPIAPKTSDKGFFFPYRCSFLPSSLIRGLKCFYARPLFYSLSLAESKYSNCALIVAVGFNRLNVKSIKKHFSLKKIVRKPTRKDAVLDLILSSMPECYAYDEPYTFPPFGLSHHGTVIAEAKTRGNILTLPKELYRSGI